ncbi:unnamed protein product [Orchesella dallaii]|uniref:Gustatory receptor n=1 Tax=Orchesella dallaii TaxID=48710 RepID=A0ABP1PWH3_9HEXA
MVSKPWVKTPAHAAFTTLFKWPLFLNQFLGQFPHPPGGITAPNYKLKLCSLKLIYTILLILITLAWETNYYARLRRYFIALRNFGPTEHFAHNLMVIVTSASGLHLQILSILKAKQIVQFCQQNCDLLAKFQGAKFNLKCRRIERVRKQGRNIVVACFLIVGTFVAYVHWYASWKFYILVGRRWLPNIEILTGTGFWALYCYSRMFNPWLFVFIKLYTVLFQELVDDLEKQKKLYNQLTFGNDQNRKDPKIFFEELILSRRKQKSSKRIFSRVHNQGESLRLLNSNLATRFGLFIEVCKTIKEFNNRMGTEILWSISSDVTNITIYFFLACFYLKFRRSLHIWQVKMETNPPTICAHGFFTINQAMSTTVVSGMSTFLVALIQFRQADKSGK